MQARLLRAGGALVAVALLFGCERLREVKRCRKLAEDVNGSLDNIEIQAQKGKTQAGYLKIASEYDALARRLEGFDGGVPELNVAVGEYQGVARSSAKQAAALASAIAADSRASASLATRELERLARHEKQLAARIDEECRPR